MANSATSHSQRATSAGNKVAKSTPNHPGTILRKGLTSQLVNASTASPSGLRNGARSTCIQNRNSSG